MRSYITTLLLTCLPSMAFSLNIFEGVSDYIHSEVRISRNADIVYKNVKYAGYEVTYQYQFWKIKHSMVCQNYKNNLADYSKCTIAAKKLFTDVCTTLKQQHNTGTRKLQQLMYCSSAQKYKPVIASITRASNKRTSEVVLARDKCNSLILQAMNTKSSSDIAKRDIACSKYKRLKNNQP